MQRGDPTPAFNKVKILIQNKDFSYEWHEPNSFDSESMVGIAIGLFQIGEEEVPESVIAASVGTKAVNRAGYENEILVADMSFFQSLITVVLEDQHHPHAAFSVYFAELSDID